MTELLDLPLSFILSLTSPRDVKRLASVSKSFLEASKTDIVWRAFVPPDRLSNSPGIPLCTLYDKLCEGVYEDSNQVYMLDRGSGSVIRMFSARALTIIWGNDQRYWSWISNESSRFREVAFLNLVWWLEIKGDLRAMLPIGTYTLSLRLMIRRSDPRYVYGWKHEPVIMSLMDNDGNLFQMSACYLDGDEGNEAEMAVPVTKHRACSDGWMEYDVGEFLVEDDKTLAEVKFRMTEIKAGMPKRGLLVDGVVIRPKYLVPS